jgi:hypothetical protein
MEARQDHPEDEAGEETVLRNPPGRNLPLNQQSTHFDEGHAVPHQSYDHIVALGDSRVHMGNVFNSPTYNISIAPPEATPRNPSSKSTRLQDALAFPEMSLRSANIATAQAQTCEWIFETPEYKRWLDPAFRPAHHGILWIKGKPGAGKSTIMKHILRASQIKHDTGKFISFFFNARGQGLARSTEGLYRALLHPIVDSVPSLQDMVDTVARRLYKDQGWPLPVLKDLFREAVRRYRYEGSLTCCIDALDECNEDDVRDMLELFEDLGEMATSEELPFSVCLTSRHYPSITIARVEELSIDNLSGHQNDISEYVNRRLKLLHVGAKLKEEMVTEIQKRSSGVFLWVVLVVGILNKTSDRGNIHLLRIRLRELPTNLRELFDNIIEREEPGVNFLPIMQWTLFSSRPLTATELYFAVMASTDSLSEMTVRCDAEVVNARVLRDFITTSSKGFLEIVHVGHHEIASPGLSVQFIHESVREFFLAYGLQRIDRSLGTLGNSVAQDSHQQLARCCLTYMQLILSQHLSSLGSRKAPSVNSLISEDSLDSAPFLAYVLFYGACYHSHNGVKNLPCDHIADDFSGLGSIMAGTYDHLGNKNYLIGLHSPLMHHWMDKAHKHLLQHAPETPDFAHVSQGNGVRLQTTWESDALHVARCKIICILLAKSDNFTTSCKPRSADFASHSGCGHAFPLLLLINYGPKAYSWTMKAHHTIQELIVAASMKDEPAVYVWIGAMADHGMLKGSLKKDICTLLHVDL